nr:hypothetical protein [Tanacetum cinerariifolium]
MSDSKDSMVTYTAAPPSPDYVPGLEYPPSPEYVLKFDFEEDLEDDHEEDPANYPANGGDDHDDYDESFDDDDDVKEDKDDDEEEHLAPTGSTGVALLADDHAPFAEETELFEADESATTPPPHPAYRVTARMS